MKRGIIVLVALLALAAFADLFLWLNSLSGEVTHLKLALAKQELATTELRTEILTRTWDMSTVSLDLKLLKDELTAVPPPVGDRQLSSGLPATSLTGRGMRGGRILASRGSRPTSRRSYLGRSSIP